jgi:hydrogenase maturation protease
MIVIGVGNRFRGDDGVGLHVAEDLLSKHLHQADVVEHSGEGTSLMELWEKEDSVILVDAVHSGKPPGTIHRFDLEKEPLPAPILRDNTHTFGVVEAIELSRVLHQLPHHFVIYGIEGKSFDSDSELSPEALRAAQEVEEQIITDLTGRKRKI